MAAPLLGVGSLLLAGVRRTRDFALAYVGLAIGVVVAFFLTKLLQGNLEGISVHDPLSFGIVSAVLLIVGLLACYLPARTAALLISKRSSMLKVGEVILAFNVALFIVAMTLLGVEAALYSILTYLSAAKTLDFVIHGIEEYTAMTIVSGESHAIREEITGTLQRGVTIYRGSGGLTNAEQEILYCVVTRLEIGKVKSIVRSIDRHAFIVSHALADVDG